MKISDFNTIICTECKTKFTPKSFDIATQINEIIVEHYQKNKNELIQTPTTEEIITTMIKCPNCGKTCIEQKTTTPNLEMLKVET